MYYVGIVDESQLDQVLELHKRSTLSAVEWLRRLQTTRNYTADEGSTRPSDDQSESDPTVISHDLIQ